MCKTIRKMKRFWISIFGCTVQKEILRQNRIFDEKVKKIIQELKDMKSNNPDRFKAYLPDMNSDEIRSILEVADMGTYTGHRVTGPQS